MRGDQGLERSDAATRARKAPPPPAPNRPARRTSAASPKSRRAARTARHRGAASGPLAGRLRRRRDHAAEGEDEAGEDPGRRRRRPAAARDHRLPVAAQPAAAAEDAHGQATRSRPPRPDRFAGHNVCQLVQAERSRVTVSPTNDMPLDWTTAGCMNGRTQYARNGDVWSRILVPNGEQTMSRCSNSGPAAANMSSPAIALDADAMDADSRAAARRRRQGLHRRRARRAPSSPTSSATSPRSAAACPTSGWSMPASISAAARRRRAMSRLAIAAALRPRRGSDQVGRKLASFRKLLAGLTALTVSLRDVGAAPNGTRPPRTISSSTAKAAEQTRAISPRKLERFHFVLRTFHRITATPAPNKLRVFLLSSAGAVGRMVGGSSVAGYYMPDARGLMLVGTRNRAAAAVNDIRSARSQAESRPREHPAPRIYPPFHVPIFPGGLPDLVQRGLRRILGRDRAPAPNDVVEVGAARPIIASRPSEQLGWLPLERLLRAHNYSEVGGTDVFLLYAEGWLLVRYVFEHPDRQRQLRRYLRLINAGTAYERGGAAGIPGSRRRSIRSCSTMPARAVSTSSACRSGRSTSARSRSARSARPSRR